MAIVTRRYVHCLPVGSNLAIYVDPVNIPTINAQYASAVVDINYDDAIPGLVEDLDSYMGQFNLVHSATASPRQVFNYVATGAEGSLIAIGALQGFNVRATSNYNVHVCLCRAAPNALKVVGIVAGTLTANGFSIELSAPIELGDALMFTVEDLT